LARRILSHTADTGIEASADDLSGLIVELATGMFESMASARPGSQPRRQVEVEIARSEPVEIVVETLSELLYTSEVEDLFLCQFEATPTGEHGMRVTAVGVPFDLVESHGPPIKAVTYHDLEIVETPEGWRGRVYFDV